MTAPERSRPGRGPEARVTRASVLVVGIFGVVDLRGLSDGPTGFETVSGAMARWSGGALRDLAFDGARFGSVDRVEAVHPDTESLPAFCRGGSVLLTAAGRVDNRDDLCRSLDIPATSSPSDGALILAAYERWG